MNSKLLMFLIVFLVSSVFAQNEEMREPSPKDMRLRTELESDNSILSIGGKNLTEVQQEEARKIRIRVYRASKKKDKTIKIKTLVKSVEGDPIVYYLIVEKGHMKFIGDYSRDPFGGLRIVIHNCDDVMIGHFVRDEPNKDASFKPLKEKEIGKIWPILQCRSGQRMFYL